MIVSTIGALYSMAAMVGIFGILLILGKDFYITCKHHSRIDNVGALAILSTLISLEVILAADLCTYYTYYHLRS